MNEEIANAHIEQSKKIIEERTRELRKDEAYRLGVMEEKKRVMDIASDYMNMADYENFRKDVNKSK